MIAQLRPTAHLRVYDLVREAGLDVSDWANYKRPESPETNPRYCYEWSFIGPDAVVVCLWHGHMDEDSAGIFQRHNYRDIPTARHDWTASQKQRCWDMDRAFVTAFKKRLPVRVIIVDGPEDENGDRSVERRSLDPEPWHIAAYDPPTGWCRLQRGPVPPVPETFTRGEISAAGTYSEGTLGEATAKTRERSARLRDLARAHFAKQSADGRLHCAACDWAPPLSLALTGPIVEIHHEVAISTLPADGLALPFADAVKFLTPLCPNCHRILHAKPGGGSFTLQAIRTSYRGAIVPANK